MATRYTTPELTILYLDEKGQETEITVQSTAADHYVFDMLRSNKKTIPSMQDSPQTWAYILSWAALKRTGHISTQDFDSWIRTSLINVDFNEPDQQEPSESLA
ncbi:hypothetical protein E4U03_07795 [Rothia nasimurium]|uniref:Uncharacterized protein n=1 Tax=Rothia nasimurium TaxID=85336 RepID=A0A4Y9F2N0_9MICC|nr:hypothetical protein [Rothia nasimurium]MBF0808510.1 hypothetical protein [Rothia nasimurium]TFU21904.1 hypothetical protein E4U03_07795 [Rothia nasimurium]